MSPFGLRRPHGLHRCPGCGDAMAGERSGVGANARLHVDRGRPEGRPGGWLESCSEVGAHAQE